MQRKGGRVHEGGGEVRGRQPNKKKPKRPKNATWGVLRQPHNFPDWKVLRFFGPGKK